MKSNNNIAILLNGPKGCGKTELGHAIIKEFKKDERFNYVGFVSCKDHLVDLTIKFFNIKESYFHYLYNDRVLKEMPNWQLFLKRDEYLKLCERLNRACSLFDEYIYISPREAMIYVSEVICKNAFGKDYFGKISAQQMADMSLGSENRCMFIDESCAFNEEVVPIVETVDNTFLIRIHGRGEFSNDDSRGYVDPQFVGSYKDVFNVAGEYDFQRYVIRSINDFLEGVIYDSYQRRCD